MERECSPGTAYDVDKGMCVPAREAICEHVNTCGHLEGGTGNAPSTQFCDEFIICYNGKQFGEPIKCPKGLIFDSIHNRCALKDDDENECYPGTIKPSNLPLAPVRRML